MKYIFFLLSTLIISATIFGQSNSTSDSTLTGVDYYRQKDYNKALSIFNESLNLGNVSEELYYNIGNTQAQLKNIPEAIWAYEKALKIDPHLTDAKNNLKQLTKSIDTEIVHIKPFFLLKWWSQINQLFRPNIWATLSLIGLVLCVSIIISTWLKIRIFTNKLILVSIFSWLILLGISYGSYHTYKYKKEAIVMYEQSIMHIGADERSDTIIQLPQGLKIRILDELKDWYKIQLPNLSQGWVMMKDVKEI